MAQHFINKPTRAWCGCLNVTFHLQSVPMYVLPSQMQYVHWFGTRCGSSSVLCGKLSVAGIRQVYEGLVQSVVVSVPNNGQWRIMRCKNCALDLCALTEANQKTDWATDTALLNPNLIYSLEKKAEAERHPTYSVVFGILINEALLTSGATLRSPNDSDPLDLLLFSTLQSKMNDFLKRETEEAQKRIRDFTEKENERLQEMETRVFQERKAIWNSLVKGGVCDQQQQLSHSKVLSLSSSSPLALSCSPLVSVNECEGKSEGKGEMKISDLERTPESHKQITSLKKGERSSHLSSPSSSSSPSTQKSPLRYRSISHRPQNAYTPSRNVPIVKDEDPLSSASLFLPGSLDDVGMERREMGDLPETDSGVIGRGYTQIASSMPVSIPRQFDDWSRDKGSRAKEIAHSYKTRAPHELVDRQDQSDLEGTFAVPISRNRARTADKKFQMM